MALARAKMIVRMKLNEICPIYDPIINFYTILHHVNDLEIKVRDCRINECTNHSLHHPSIINLHSIPDTSALAVLLCQICSSFEFG